jgi:hypothetical protein
VGSGVGEGRATVAGTEAGGCFAVSEAGTGFTNSFEVDGIALRSFGWGEAAAFATVGGGAVSDFCFCSRGSRDVTAFTRLGAGGPTISEGFGERVAIALMYLGAGVGAACKSSGEGEAATFASLGEGAGFTRAVEAEGDGFASAVADEDGGFSRIVGDEDAFSQAPLVGLELADGPFKPLFGAVPE